MARKDLRSLAASLTSVAATLPTQNVIPTPVAVAPSSAPEEPVVQFSFGLRKSQRRELQRLAADADMTMRAFILSALKGQGLTVLESDLLDMRKR